MLTGILTTLVLFAAPAPQVEHHELLHGRLRIDLPMGYERRESSIHESGVLFVRRGDWATALAKALPREEYDSSFLKDWFRDDIRDYVKVRTVELTSPGDVEASPAQIHARFARGFIERWGTHSFCFFDDPTGVGRCVNYAGAFVFVATRKLEDTLLVVEAMDNVEALVAEEGTIPSETSTAPVLWDYFRRAANEDTVAIVLSSARTVK